MIPPSLRLPSLPAQSFASSVVPLDPVVEDDEEVEVGSEGHHSRVRNETKREGMGRRRKKNRTNVSDRVLISRERTETRRRREKGVGG